MDTLIPINIIIADRSYRIKIEPADEEVVRKTIKLINDKILEFKTQFAGKDMQDYIAMVLIWLAIEQPATVISNENLEEVSGKIKSLQQLIANSL